MWNVNGTRVWIMPCDEWTGKCDEDMKCEISLSENMSEDAAMRLDQIKG